MATIIAYKQALVGFSTAYFDGTHIPCKRGRESVGYQARKSCKTINSLIVCDNNVLPLAIGNPPSCNHNDLHKLNRIFDEMIVFLETATISMESVFMSSDVGFDSKSFKKNYDSKALNLNVKDTPKKL